MKSIIPQLIAVGRADRSRRLLLRVAKRLGCAAAVPLFALIVVCSVSTPLSAANVASALASPPPSEGSVFANGIRLQDEIVLVDVRRLGSCCLPEIISERIRVQSYQVADERGRRRWLPSDVQSVRAADPTVSTVIYVHGNRMTPADARREGLSVYRRMVRQSVSSAPIRFVIFSWPSSKVRGPLKDVRIKAARTQPAGCQLAWFVDQLPADTPVSMVGFSFGARIITGSLHILGGGSLGHYDVAELENPARAPMNVVLISAALNADWLCRGHHHGQAMTRVDQMLLLNNRQDPAMRYYHLSTKQGRPTGLGLCGPSCIDADEAAKITKRGLSRYIGSSHDLFCYLSAPGVASQLWEAASRER